MKFEIHFEFRASLRKFQDLNFWDATYDHAVNLLEKDLSAFLSYGSVILIRALSLFCLCELLLLCCALVCVFYSPPYSGFDCNHLCKA
jgi:hypothetical protein